MTAGLTEKDFAGVTAENAATVGQKLYIRYGITGVRGQVEAGLPTVLNVGLPVLEEGLARVTTSTASAAAHCWPSWPTAPIPTSLPARAGSVSWPSPKS